MALKEATIRLNGQTYRLARQDVVNKALGGTARRWEMTRLRMTTKRERRSNVTQTDIPNEYIITYDDWSKGVTGDHDPIPGTIVSAQMVNPTVPGRLLSCPSTQTLYQATTDTEATTCVPIVFNNRLYSFLGRYVYVLNDDDWAQVKDWGTNIWATDAIMFDNQLVIGFGSRAKIQTMDLMQTFTVATDATYAKFFGVSERRLWRSINQQVSNIASGSNPLTLTSWSSGIAIGETGSAITDLNGVGERLAVSKTDGLYIGDSAAIFPNVLENMRFSPDADNGKGTIVRGNDVFWPHRHGLYRYSAGAGEEIGLQEALTSLDPADDNPGWRITALTADKKYLWAAAAPAHFPRAKPTGFLATTDNEATFTSYLTNVTDNLMTTAGQLANLGTSADGDYFYVGYSAIFRGVYLDIGSENTNNAILQAEFWNGSAWAALPAVGSIPTALIDGTSVNGKTFARSGVVYWQNDPTGWALKTINAVSAYWIRFSLVNKVGTLDACDANTGWSSGTGGQPTVDAADKAEGTGSLQYDGGSYNNFLKSTWAADLSTYQETGFLHFYYKHDGATVFWMTIQLGNDASNFWTWMAFLAPATSWAAMPLQLAYTTKVGNPTLLSAINWFSLTTLPLSGARTIHLDYIRFYGSQGFDSEVNVRECRVILNDPWVQVYRGRSRTSADVRPQSIIWEPCLKAGGDGTGISEALAIVPTDSELYPRSYGGGVIVFSRQQARVFLWNGDVLNSAICQGNVAGQFWLAKDDAGTPHINKQWLGISVKGKTIDANHLVDLYYREDETSTWDTGQASIAASPTTISLSGITGRALQLRGDLAVITNDVPTEINEIEVRFRELPTWKRQYKAILELTENMTATKGTKMPSPAVQLTNLETALAAGPVTLLAPEGTSYTVTVDAADVVELAQAGIDYPALLVQVSMTQT